MRILLLVWRECHGLLGKLADLPHHPYFPLYAPWDHVRQRLVLLRQQAAADRHIRALGLQETHIGWAIPARPE